MEKDNITATRLFDLAYKIWMKPVATTEQCEEWLYLMTISSVLLLNNGCPFSLLCFIKVRLLKVIPRAGARKAVQHSCGRRCSLLCPYARLLRGVPQRVTRI